MANYDSEKPSVATAPKPEVTIGHTLLGLTHSYLIQGWLGEGSFGRVAKCQTLDSKQTVAVKILKEKWFKDPEHEVSMLEELRVLDPVRTNIVHFVEQFNFMGLHCLTFEMLDIDLFKFVVNYSTSLKLMEIRPIAHQLLVALDALKGLGILHTDIKPDNVVFTNLQDQPLRVKAPEITLGLPYNEAIDVWGVGCVLAFLYLAKNLFPVYCEYQMVKRMVALLGLPPDHMLRAGVYTWKFFTKVHPDGTEWRLLTAEEYAMKNNKTTQEKPLEYEVPPCLDHLFNIYHIYPDNSAEDKDREAFIDLLKGMLSLSKTQRVTPRQALQHSYITMSHLQDAKLQEYLTFSEELMLICPRLDSSLSPPDETVCVSESESDDQESGVWSLSGPSCPPCSSLSGPSCSPCSSLSEPSCSPCSSLSEPSCSPCSSLSEPSCSPCSFLSEPSCSTCSSEHTAPLSSRDERESVYYRSSTVPLTLVGVAEKAVTVQEEDMPHTRAAPKRSRFWRIPRFFRRVAEALRRSVRLHH